VEQGTMYYEEKSHCRVGEGKSLHAVARKKVSERREHQLSLSIASFSNFFFIELTSLDICPDDIQPSGKAATIF